MPPEMPENAIGLLYHHQRASDGGCSCCVSCLPVLLLRLLTPASIHDWFTVGKTLHYEATWYEPDTKMLRRRRYNPKWVPENSEFYERFANYVGGPIPDNQDFDFSNRRLLVRNLINHYSSSLVVMQSKEDAESVFVVLSMSAELEPFHIALMATGHFEDGGTKEEPGYRESVAAPHGRCKLCKEAIETYNKPRLCLACERTQGSDYCSRCGDRQEGITCEFCDSKDIMRRLGAFPD